MFVSFRSFPCLTLCSFAIALLVLPQSGVRTAAVKAAVQKTSKPGETVAAYKWTEMTSSAAFRPRDGAGAVAFNNRMYLLGGWIAQPYACINEVWTSTDGKSWKMVNYAPWEGRHCDGNVIFESKMWVVGGDQAHGHYQSDVWNTTDGVNWTKVTAEAPWGQRALHVTGVYKGRIWVMGGQTLPQYAPGPDVLYNDVWSSIDGKTWTQVTANAPWSPRGMIDRAVEFNGRMWLVGGGTFQTPAHHSRQYYNEVWSTTDGLNWRKDLAQAPWEPREYHSVAVFDNKIWVLGGWHDYNLSDVWYSSDGVNWTELPNTPWPERHAPSVFVYDNHLWVTGGSGPKDSNDPQQDVWRLDKVATSSGTSADTGPGSNPIR